MPELRLLRRWSQCCSYSALLCSLHYELLHVWSFSIALCLCVSSVLLAFWSPCTVICVTFSLPPGVRGWLRLLLVALPGLFGLSFFIAPELSYFYYEWMMKILILIPKIQEKSLYIRQYWSIFPLSRFVIQPSDLMSRLLHYQNHF